MTHICLGKLTVIGSDNGLSPGRHKAIIWTNAGILLIRTLGTNLSEILNKIDTFSYNKMHLNNVVSEMAAIWSRPQCDNDAAGIPRVNYANAEALTPCIMKYSTYVVWTRNGRGGFLLQWWRFFINCAIQWRGMIYNQNTYWCLLTRLKHTKCK